VPAWITSPSLSRRNYVVNTIAADEHVGEIERKIQHVKTRARSLKASLPFKIQEIAKRNDQGLDIQRHNVDECFD
jgi:hypothetical protein